MGSFGDGSAAALRRDRTKHWHVRLCKAISAWLGDWDEEPRQRSQLGLLQATLEHSLARIAAGVDAVGTADLATTATACRAIDVQLAVVERVWRHFQVRFDQRRDRAIGRLLQAADNVTWSCHAGFAAVAPAGPPPPLPLAYLEPMYTATAIPRGDPPAGLSAIDGLLADLLRELPMPLIALPTALSDEPWWLGVIAHEVGHHIQYDLEPGGALIARAGALLDADEPEADRTRWARWAKELFADACSVACIGTAASWLVAELEWGDAAAMSRARVQYPPVMVRLAAMGELAAGLGLASPPFRTGTWASAVDPAVAPDLVRAPAVAKALLEMKLGSATLTTLPERVEPADEDPRAGDPRIMAAFLAGGEPMLRRSRRGARVAAAMALGAYRTLAGLPDAEREAARAALRDRTIDQVGEDTVVRAGAAKTARSLGIATGDRLVEAAGALATRGEA